MPTCFVAIYGSGKPVIGILGEYDALPMISQKGRVPSQDHLVRRRVDDLRRLTTVALRLKADFRRAHTQAKGDQDHEQGQSSQDVGPIPGTGTRFVEELSCHCHPPSTGLFDRRGFHIEKT